MNVFKKLIAAASAIVSVSAFASASAAVYADETTTTTDVTTTTVSEQADTTTSETTTDTTDTSETSDTTTTTTAPVKYKAWLSFNGGGNIQSENAVEFSTNGTYTVKYKFSAEDAAAVIDSIVLESDVTTETAADFKFKVTGIKIGKDENLTTNFSFDSTASDAFTTDQTSKTYLLNIINKDQDIEDLSVSEDFKANADDILFVTFTVEGLAEPETTTTTTTTRTITYSGYSNNGYNNNTTTNTVSKTADEGVIAIVVSAVAAAALAAGAFTIKKKRN